MRQKLPIATVNWIQCISSHQDSVILAIAGTDAFIRILNRGFDAFSIRNKFKVSSFPVFALD
jgi:hypothetical protein